MVLSSSRREGAQVSSSSGGEWYRKEEGSVVIIFCKAWRYGWEYPRGRRLVDCFRVCICIALPTTVDAAINTNISMRPVQDPQTPRALFRPKESLICCPKPNART